MPAVDEIYNIQLSQTLNKKISEYKPVLVTICLLEVKHSMYIKFPTSQGKWSHNQEKKKQRTYKLFATRFRVNKEALSFTINNHQCYWPNILKKAYLRS